ncbi:MAG: hypothetical protein GY820_44575 [Gammaproteobacteria bacterium]|nr:hypothetical protein [Gammaproteobacteria bacterium]
MTVSQPTKLPAQLDLKAEKTTVKIRLKAEKILSTNLLHSDVLGKHRKAVARDFRHDKSGGRQNVQQPNHNYKFLDFRTTRKL